MKRVKDEERIIAKGKLDIIYAQINPHFLYNTLDAISVLTLMEENEKCFQMIQVLGNFYKNSLNSGLDYISVEDEIIFIVSDDGVGMSDEKIEDILAGRTVTGKSGFGLYSLIQRIRLTYGIENPIIIQSEVGVGTEIIVTIKKIKMEK